MSAKTLQTRPAGSQGEVLRWARYVFFGGFAGLVIGIAVLFAVSLAYGALIGLPAGDCAALGCTMTAMLSQPAGVGGMLAGAVVGFIAGAVVHHAHHSPR
jgi:hypothetical protein